jgi:hypothetical protein
MLGGGTVRRWSRWGRCKLGISDYRLTDLPKDRLYRAVSVGSVQVSAVSCRSASSPTRRTDRGNANQTACTACSWLPGWFDWSPGPPHTISMRGGRSWSDQNKMFWQRHLRWLSPLVLGLSGVFRACLAPVTRSLRLPVVGSPLRERPVEWCLEQGTKAAWWSVGQSALCRWSEPRKLRVHGQERRSVGRRGSTCWGRALAVAGGPR